MGRRPIAKSVVFFKNGEGVHDEKGTQSLTPEIPSSVGPFRIFDQKKKENKEKEKKKKEKRKKKKEKRKKKKEKRKKKKEKRKKKK